MTELPNVTKLEKSFSKERIWCLKNGFKPIPEPKKFQEGLFMLYEKWGEVSIAEIRSESEMKCFGLERNTPGGKQQWFKV